MAPRKRDNSYYRKRLEAEHPAIFAKLKAGEFRSESEAFIAAGLRKAPTTINALQRAWRLASPAEKREFVAANRVGAPKKGGAPPSRPDPVVDGKGRLTSAVAGKLAAILASRNISISVALTEMGLSVYDYTLSIAPTNRSPVREDVAVALQRWLAANSRHIPW